METSLKTKMSKMQVMEGSHAVAEIVRMCKPQVISAYPITPQTHIVEDISKMVADGVLKTEYVRVESEHSAASVCLGAAATGVRTYTATTSQGLLLMAEVLFSIAGMRLPVVLTCANRSVSSPLSIWNDHQDSMTVRDSGWIQFYGEDNQEVVDLHIQAYKIGENQEISLPVMICMDGFLLTHTFEPIELPTQEQIDSFLPSFKPEYYLDPANPHTFGCFAEPDKYMEFRYLLYEAQMKAKKLIPQIAKEFKEKFGRDSGGLVQAYKLEDADTVLVGMGTIVSVLKAASDKLREQGKKVGVLKVISYRPFPVEEILSLLKSKKNIVVFDKSVSMGLGSILGSDIRSVLAGEKVGSNVSIIVAGLAGRDVPVESIIKAVNRAEKETINSEFLDLRTEII